MIAAGVLGGLLFLGIFVNALFLLAAVFSLCGLMHVLGGHHGHNARERGSPTNEKESS